MLSVTLMSENARMITKNVASWGLPELVSDLVRRPVEVRADNDDVGIVLPVASSCDMGYGL